MAITRLHLVFLSSLCLLANAFSMVDLNNKLYSTENKPAQALIDILKELNMQHDGTWPSINQAMQKRLLIEGVPDWRMPESPRHDHAVLIPLLTDLGMFGDILPNKRDYDAVILLGGNLWSMRQRIAYIVKLWNEGYTFKKIVIMAGGHPLEKGRYTYADFFEYSHPNLPLKTDWQPWQTFPKNGAELILMILEQVHLPSSLRNIQWEMIVSERDPITGKRPTTLNNALDFFAKHGDGSYLIISNQPFVGYQHAVFANHAPSNIDIETVGPKAFGDYNMTMYLDRLTRWVWEVSKKHDM